MVLQSFLNSDILQALAWIFTVLSGVASIALTIHKVGLAPWKRVILIVGVIILGLVIVLVVIPATNTMSGPAVVSVEERTNAQTITQTIGANHIGAITQDQDGNLNTVVARGGVKRVSQTMYAIQVPDGSKVYVFSGASFDAEIDGQKTNCQLLEAIEGQVIIVYGNNALPVQLEGDQSSSLFKVEKLSVNLGA